MDDKPLKRPLEVEIALTVKTYDIDFAGIVSNIVYIRWLEDLRLEILARHSPLEQQLKDGIAPVLLKTTIDYKQSIRFGDTAMGRMWAESMGSLRWIVRAEIIANGQLAAQSKQVGIYVDLQTGKPIRLPAQLRQQYEQFREQLC
ncbi:MAG: acyl-CoA thioesterase [Cyanophyceae cyanobacterium]